MTTETEVDRRSLRAYHRRLQDFILGCIKDDNLKYRQTKNSIILYPPDDTSPITVYARNTDRQIRQLQKWYLDHVYVEPAKGSVDEEQITALAKAVNSPEHPVEEKQKARLPMGDPATEVGGTTHKPSEEPPVAPPADQPDGVRSNAEWVPYQRDDGSTDEFIETDGTTFRCRLCLGGEHPLLSENRRSIGGHKRMWHTDRTNLHAPETRAKAGDTTRYNHVKARLIETLVPLLESVGYEAEAKDDPRVKVLEKELAEKDKALSKVQGQLDEATGRVEELEARLALMREALTA